jgi:hypothetical protein
LLTEVLVKISISPVAKNFFDTKSILSFQSTASTGTEIWFAKSSQYDAAKNKTVQNHDDFLNNQES